MSRRDPRDDLAEFSAMLSRGQSGSNIRPDDPHAVATARRRRKRRRISALVVTLVVLAAVGTYVPMTLLAPAGAANVSRTAHTITTPAAAAFALPRGTEAAASIAGGADFEKLTGSKELLPTSGANNPLPIASISKLITALVILDAKPLSKDQTGPTITFSKDDSKLYDKYYVLGASIAKMDSGSTMSEHDALAVMLVASACNYAEAVSTWAFGSHARFISATKAWLSKNGLSGTTMVESTGIDPRNASTPTDLIAIGKIALANSVVAAIVATPSISIAGAGAIYNNNELLGTDGVNGIKTGTLAEAGACLLFSAIVSVDGLSPLTLIGVVLGGGNHQAINTDVGILIKSITGSFHTVRLTSQGDDYGQYTTAWKSQAGVVTGSTASVLTFSDTKITSTVTTTAVTEAASDTKVGSVTFTAGKSTVTVPLVLRGAITAPDGWWRLTHPVELLGK
jgi:D-alanyl-D-alanine carboxypeptidase (penicillin-binding protein 5/6)